VRQHLPEPLHKDLNMGPFGHVALAVTAAALTSCASPAPFEYTATDAAVIIAQMSAFEAPVPVSDFDAMRAALPGFELLKTFDGASENEVSVVRDLTSTPESSILSRADVTRLEPLHADLRANPSIAVRITGYGDGSNAADRTADLSLSRAQAVARALLTDMRVANSIDAAGAAMPQQKQYVGHAQIVFALPVASPGE
jgi:outer membrane protein OmpA-like peptidoglycan-associated protein